MGLRSRTVRLAVVLALASLADQASGRAACAQGDGRAGAQTAPRDAVAPRETLARIAALLEGSDLQAAAAAVNEAIAAHPRDGVLQDFAGIVAAQRADGAAAERHFRAAIGLTPGLRSAYLNLGRLYVERGDTTARDQAIAIYRQWLARAAADPEALYQVSFLLARSGRFAEARSFAARLPADVQRRPQALALTTVIAAGTGDDAVAASAVSALAAHPELDAADVDGVLPAFEHVRDRSSLLALLEAADRRQRASVAARRQLAQVYLASDRPGQAREVLERAAAQTPPSVPLLTDLARAAYRARDFRGALGYLARARDLEPDNAAVHFFFGIACIEQNLGAEAYDSLRRAVALEPQNAYVNYALGAVALHRHEPAEALPYFEAYLRLRPEDPRSRFALGAARFYSNQLEEARQDLTLAAGRPETAAGAHYFLGRIARQLNDLPAAEAALRRALELNPSHADSWAELGLVQMRAGAYDAAAASLAKATAIEPDNYTAAVNLAALYGRTRDARRVAQEARVRALQDARAIRAQEFLRLVQVVP